MSAHRTDETLRQFIDRWYATAGKYGVPRVIAEACTGHVIKAHMILNKTGK